MPGWLSLSGTGSLDYVKRSYRFDGDGVSVNLSAETEDDSFLRSLIGFRVLSGSGLATPATDPVVLYVNGDFEGLYLRIERIDRDFYARRGVVAERIYKSKVWLARFRPDLALDPTAGFESVLGGFHAPEIGRIAEAANAEPVPETRARLEASLDVANATLFLALNVVLANCDGMANNLYLVKARGRPRLSFAVWDWDRALDFGCDVGFQLGISRLFEQLLAFPDLRAEFDRLVGLWTRERLTPKSLRAIAEAESARIAAAYRADRFLGGRGHDLARERGRLVDFYAGRVSTLSRSR